MYECYNARGISLLNVVGKVYGRVLINRIKDKTEDAILEKPAGFRKGRRFMDQIFTVEQICKKYLAKHDTALVIDSGEKLGRLVTWFGKVCDRRKLRVNGAKRKVMRIMGKEGSARLNVMLNGELLDEIAQFTNLGSVVAANGGVGADVRQSVN
ncbi:uncharacterized protein [Palaemon carinicauda]|uniref:uncharacterized protein n=1 Tax=Palaemon carinicauda TaxID=392227 RepID=UPI0035B66921